MSASGFPALSGAAIAAVLQSGRYLLVQGAMGLHSSDGLAGKVAAARSARFACVGTVSGVCKTPETLRRELHRARREAPGGFVGVNLMAAINHEDFKDLARVSIEEGVSFIVQGAGISREIVRWCREAGSVRRHRVLGPARRHVREVGRRVPGGGGCRGGRSHRGHRAAPGVARRRGQAPHLPAGGGGRRGRRAGRRPVPGARSRRGPARNPVHRLQRRRCARGLQGDAPRQERRGRRRDHELREGDEGARGAERLHGRAGRGRHFPPRSKAWFFGSAGYRGRRKACIECLAQGLCKCQTSGFPRASASRTPCYER